MRARRVLGCFYFTIHSSLGSWEEYAIVQKAEELHPSGHTSEHGCLSLTSPHYFSSGNCHCAIQFNSYDKIQYNSYYASSTRWGGAEVALGIYYKTFVIYRTCMRRAPARPVRACFVRSCCTDVCSTALYYKACTKHFPVLLCTTKLAQSTSQDYSVLPNYAQSTSQYYFVLKLAQSISQYYYVLQSLHKALASTPLYYKACTKHVPPATTLYCKACTTAFPSTTTPYHKACTKHFPVLLCTTKLVQSTSQYCAVLPTMHKVRPSATLY